jgi:hypothetical protein
MDQGARWIYEGQVQWTVPGAAKVKTARIQWVTEVVEVFNGPQVQAAIVRGFPDELAWYEPGQSPRFSVLLSLSNQLYRIRLDGLRVGGVTSQHLTY